MRHIVSVSLGSSRRNHSVVETIGGSPVKIERIGTDGDLEAAVALIRRLDGAVDAIGLGGIDLYVYAGSRRYEFRDARRLASAASRSPVADGSGLKNTLERQTVRWIDENLFRWQGKRVLLVSSVDRFGMAEALAGHGANLIFGDLMFGLGLRIPVRRLSVVRVLARLLLPVVTRLPFRWLYPTGKEQERRVTGLESYYAWAEVIAGDWHYINRYLPARLDGKVVLTNTLTADDITALRERGARQVISTTPSLAGRSFGTNVMEGLILALAGKHQDQMEPQDYDAWIASMGFAPHVVSLLGASS